MKNDAIGKPLGTDLDQLRALTDEDIVLDEDSPYDPNDPFAVEAFWANAIVTSGGGVATTLATLHRARGPGRKPRKQALTVRYSPEVIAYFKGTGQGWQTRMDEALKEWIAQRLR
ncbi:MAG: BrnA antitoxin family protein [Candidatus Competibacteraceae bacterium]|nr:BrnA antitoxin family protein [Candidatus Competibacteraceae bacterium]